MTKQEQIAEMTKDIEKTILGLGIHLCHKSAEKLLNLGYRKLPEDSVVLSSEEYEKLRSLYDCEQGSYMTSSIGDLPLTVEGLRKAVDEITRLNRVEAELQELNIKYYNEAKDLRREVAELKAENKQFSEKLGQVLLSIDTVKEMNTMRNIDDYRKQAVKEFAEKLRKKVISLNVWEFGEIDIIDVDDIDELLKEYEK